MGTRPDYYRILGVMYGATDNDIHLAFRQRARQLHPDLNPSPDATMRFQELNAAYAVLKNPLRRYAYDRRTGRVRTPSVRPDPAYSTNPAPAAAPARNRAGLILTIAMIGVGAASVSTFLAAVTLSSILSKSGSPILTWLSTAFAAIGEVGFYAACTAAIVMVLGLYVWLRIGGKKRD